MDWTFLCIWLTFDSHSTNCARHGSSWLSIAIGETSRRHLKTPGCLCPGCPDMPGILNHIAFSRQSWFLGESKADLLMTVSDSQGQYVVSPNRPNTQNAKISKAEKMSIWWLPTLNSWVATTECSASFLHLKIVDHNHPFCKRKTVMWVLGYYIKLKKKDYNQILTLDIFGPNLYITMGLQLVYFMEQI